MVKKVLIDEQKVIELFAEYDNCRQVAEELCVCGETIRRILIKHGVCRTGNKRDNRKHYIANCAHRNYCYALFRILFDVCGLSLNQIADYLNVSRDVAYRACCTSRKLHSRSNREDFDINAIEAEYIAGASCCELGKKYGVDNTTISRWMRQRGHNRGKFAQKNQLITCATCGKHFIATRHNSKYCSKKCFYNSSNRDSDYKKRSLRYGVEYDSSITLDSVYRHDDGVCYICGSSCDYGDVLPSGAVGHFYPTIDHVTALSKGGGHVWNNVRLAHMLCNSMKQDRDLTDELRKSIIERISTESGENKQQRSNHCCVA